MIPDKIYIPLYPNLDTDGFHLGDDWMEKPDSCSKCEHVEYLRKDTLLKWAKERYKSTISNVGCYTGHSVWAEVIEKLESL